MPEPAPPTLWTLQFRSLLCAVYQAFGGSCVGLDWTNGGWGAVETISDALASQGPPTFPTQEDEDAFLATLDTLEAHLDSPESTLSQELTAEVQALISDLRAAVGSA